MEEHLFCECGGIIGSYNRGDYCICERCRKEYTFQKLKYDTIRINIQTGWIFPMAYK